MTRSESKYTREKSCSDNTPMTRQGQKVRQRHGKVRKFNMDMMTRQESTPGTKGWESTSGSESTPEILKGRKFRTPGTRQSQNAYRKQQVQTVTPGTRQGQKVYQGYAWVEFVVTKAFRSVYPCQFRQPMVKVRGSWTLQHAGVHCRYVGYRYGTVFWLLYTVAMLITWHSLNWNSFTHSQGHV